MKKQKLIYIILLFVAISCALAFTAVRTIALIDEFDADIGYYAHDAVFPDVFAWGGLFAVIIIFITSFAIRRTLNGAVLDSDSGAVTFSAALMAFMIIAVCISDLFNFSAVKSAGALYIITILSMVFSIPAALYCLFAVAMPVKSKDVRTVLAIFLMLWFFTVTLKIYFADGLALNDPNRTLELTAVALYLFYFVNECRYANGNAKGWSYAAFGLSALVIGGMYCLPNIILALMKLYPASLVFSFELIVTVIWIYILMRMCIFASVIDSGDGEYDGDDGNEASADADEVAEITENPQL